MSAATDVIVVSSSPERIPCHTPTGPPAYDPERLFGLSPREYSSPSVPSPSELFRAKSQSRFFSTKNQADGARPDANEISREPTNAGEANKTGRETKSKLLGVGEKRRGRKPKVARDEQDAPAELESSVAGKNANTSEVNTGTKKKRSVGSKKQTKSANKTLTGRVAKSGSVATIEPLKADCCPSTPKFSSEQKAAEQTDDWQNDGLQLEPAMKRRLDWTPVKNTTKSVCETVVELEEVSHSANDSGFGGLISGYGFNGVSDTSRDTPNVAEEAGPTKRRRIELVDSRCHPTALHASNTTSDNTPTESETQFSKTQKPERKRKTKPKKITTLTGRVTALYNNSVAESTDSASQATLDSGEGAVATKQNRAKSKRKGKATSQPQEPQFTVLSPEAAAKSIEDQDLVFGTCSQLEREESPETLREMQAAIYESERSMATDPLPQGSRPGLSSNTITRFNNTKSLWSIAARDSEGSLVQAEVLDMVDMSALSKSSRESNEDKCPEKSISNEQINDNSKQHAVIELETDKQVPVVDAASSTAPTTILPQEPQISQDKPQTPQLPETNPPMPQFNAFTDAELSKQITSYGFKPLKSRKKMVELLQKCWESKRGPHSNADDKQPNPPASQTSSSQQHAPEKRQRKTNTTKKTSTTSKAKFQPRTSAKSAAVNAQSQASDPKDNNQPPSVRASTPETVPPRRSFIDVEEIEDSEDEVIPSPHRLQGRYTTNPTEKKQQQSLPITPLPISPSKAHATSSKTEAVPPELSSQITAAVRAQTRTPSHNGRLTWHEKILMYDPLILEDFTAWLNTEGLGLVHEDREVGAGFVRTWCESKGICCCYRRLGSGGR
ncbi:hypothetical protein P168DRAFT_325360 [Aspergillus campestris IBT 28561]|uniref:Structure-specific endonuclease subunit SLX4 n=1 Tax=Aspergillus campestris (strain IBT 28561) TaxID=1392248 RepID=A0A2I1D9G4_ASPC2|nr:uncharacterized protein P168DRAFT_325360 [Aspergillus campestris IBT 28561]PKY06498.1 hypothetical protein P168DRAFT_325360 [Aspergillus campestris IBT 28561]